MGSNVDLFRRFTPTTSLDIPPLRTGADFQIQEAGEELLRKATEEAEKLKARVAQQKAIEKLTTSLGKSQGLPSGVSLQPKEIARVAATKSVGALNTLSKALKFGGMGLSTAQMALYSEDVGAGSDIPQSQYPKGNPAGVTPVADAPPQADFSVAAQGNLPNPPTEQVPTNVPTQGTQVKKPKVIAEIDPRAHRAGTFGNYEIQRDERGNRFVVEKEVAPQVSVDAELKRQTTKSNSHDLVNELDVISKLEGPARFERMMQLFQNIEEAKALRLRELQTVASVRSGYDEANINLQSVQKLEHISGFSSRMPGKMSTEQKEAHALVGQTIDVQQTLLRNLVISDPEYQHLETLSKRLSIYDQRAMTEEARRLNKEDIKEQEMGDITPSKIVAFRIMYDVPPTVSDAEAKTTIHAKRKTDKQFAQLIEIERSNSLDYLSHKDRNVRDKAAKFLLTGMKVPPDSTEAKFIKAFAADRTIALDKEGKNLIAEAKLGTPGSQEKLDTYESKIRSSLEQQLLELHAANVGNLKTWTPVDQDLSKVINDFSLANPSGKVDFKDIIKQYIGASIGEERQQKIVTLNHELERRIAVDQQNNFLPIDYSATMLRFKQQIKIEADRSLAGILLDKAVGINQRFAEHLPLGMAKNVIGAATQAVFGPNIKE